MRMAAGKQPVDLRPRNRERRPRHLSRIVIERDEQHGRCGRQQLHELRRIALLQVGGKGDEGRAIVDAGNAGNGVARQLEDVAAPELVRRPPT